MLISLLIHELEGKMSKGHMFLIVSIAKDHSICLVKDDMAHVSTDKYICIGKQAARVLANNNSRNKPMDASKMKVWWSSHTKFMVKTTEPLRSMSTDLAEQIWNMPIEDVDKALRSRDLDVTALVKNVTELISDTLNKCKSPSKQEVSSIIDNHAKAALNGVDAAKLASIIATLVTQLATLFNRKVENLQWGILTDDTGKQTLGIALSTNQQKIGLRPASRRLVTLGNQANKVKAFALVKMVGYGVYFALKEGRDINTVTPNELKGYIDQGDQKISQRRFKHRGSLQQLATYELNRLH